MSSLISMGQKAKEASYELGVASPGQKNEALTFMAEELIKAKEEIIKANEIDRQNAIKKGITDALQTSFIVSRKDRWHCFGNCLSCRLTPGMSL